MRQETKEEGGKEREKKMKRKDKEAQVRLLDPTREAYILPRNVNFLTDRAV